MKRLRILFDLLKDGVDKGVFPGAVAGIFNQGSTYIISAGYASYTPFLEPLEEDMIFDLASLTKPLALGLTLINLMGESSLIDLYKPLKDYLPVEGPLGEIPLFRFLNHTSGLKAWCPFYKERPLTLQKIIYTILNLPLEYKPGEKYLYSDLNFFVVTYLLEHIYGEPFEVLFNKTKEKLSLKKREVLLFNPLRKGIDPERIVPTSVDWESGKLLRGLAEDENTRALSGVSGTAGLFGNVYGVLAVLKVLLDVYCGLSNILNREICRIFFEFEDPSSCFTLTFMKPSKEGHSATGGVFSSKTVGHLGYTGCSFFMDLERGLIVVLLSNRVHPYRCNEAIKEFRPQFHRCVVEALGKV
ncbi:MAG: beta-lactamase family protein [Caldimicrobium sp.]|nr:beta-lactamase family protein [Caldimicrobium sp.]MCX7873638.1 beta-lactamase family protein [Caldimicrobium sp.]MDW8094329.1 serine hydrolase domain-containing protein [Caldimicrobium sp.]